MRIIEYKDSITIDEVKSGEIIRTETGNFYLVVKAPRCKPRFIRVDLSKEERNFAGKITEVFNVNGQARILPTEKEV